jgi:hypothetical protein
MHARLLPGAGRWPRRAAGRGAAGCLAAAAIGTLLVTGCGGGHPVTAAPCGTAHTAAGVPVHVRVLRGKVSCSTAMAVEQDYTREVRAGQAPGAGAGGPVSVHGWTCQAYTTPEVLKTGKASKCVQGGREILAVLPPPA